MQKVKLPRNIKEESTERLVSNKWQQQPQFSGVSSSLPQHTDTTGMMDLVKYLAHRELVSSGLTRFDDRPEPGGPHSSIQQKTWVLQLVRS